MEAFTFEQTKTGETAVRLGRMVFTAIPSDDGFKVYGSFASGEIAELSNRDFNSFYGNAKDQVGFEAFLDGYRTHVKQLKKLDRPHVNTTIQTPWGLSDGGEQYGPGLIKFSTPSHGGFKVSDESNQEIPQLFRKGDGWYEEDREWSKVALSFPALFTDLEVTRAKQIAINEFPFDYETVAGIEIAAGQSRIKDEKLFHEANAHNWIVFSASTPFRNDDGLTVVTCSATKGGQRPVRVTGTETIVEERQFIVPLNEYETRPQFGFVIDPDRHAVLDGAVRSFGM